MITSINEFKTQMNEKLQSDILRQIIKSEKNIKHNLYNIDLANITDNDFIELSGSEARKAIYNSHYLFWFNGDKFLAYSYGKNIYYMPNSRQYAGSGMRGQIKYPSTLELVRSIPNISVYALPRNVAEGEIFDKRRQRRDDRSGALALQDPKYIKDENIKRYRSILATKNSTLNEIDGIVKYFMKKYLDKLSNITLSDDQEIAHNRYGGSNGSIGEIKKQISNINSKLTNLLDNYNDYIYIIDNAKTGNMYAHQENEKTNLENKFKKWKTDDVVENKKNIIKEDYDPNEPFDLNNDNEEDLYHEINWDEMEKSLISFSSVYPKEDYSIIRQTYNFLKEKILEYKMTN